MKQNKMLKYWTTSYNKVMHEKKNYKKICSYDVLTCRIMGAYVVCCVIIDEWIYTYIYY
jgi:hypothetical protein